MSHNEVVVIWAPPSTVARPQIVCIDPGHPSEVGRGTRGRRFSEIQVAWSIANLVKENLQGHGIRVILTKNREEEFVTNRRRADIANSAHADLMIRLHCDAGSGSGFTTYYPDHQGVSRGFVGPSQSLLRKEAPIAQRFHRNLSEGLRGFLFDNGLKGDELTAVGRKQGALTGSIFAREPVILIEMVVLTHPADEAKIASDRGRRRIAAAISTAIEETLSFSRTVGLGQVRLNL
jgi:N-acetylmuramoyl-L-alanine amidase